MRFRAMLVVGLAVSAMACEGVVFVISPTPVPAKNAGSEQTGANIVVIASVTPAPPATAASAARLELFNASMVAPSGRQGFYALTFLITETSGSSGAVVKSILVVPPVGDSDQTDETCWHSPLRVEAGTTSDAFRAGSSRVPYSCAPGVVAPVKPAFVTVTIRYVDDAGATGVLSARIDN